MSFNLDDTAWDLKIKIPDCERQERARRWYFEHRRARRFGNFCFNFCKVCDKIQKYEYEKSLKK